MNRRDFIHALNVSMQDHWRHGSLTPPGPYNFWSSILRRRIRPDTFQAVNTILRTAAFDTWLAGLRDPIGKARIVERIRSAERGQLGDCKPVGQGVSEMRIHAGPGYRVYFTRTGSVVHVLLCGGGKGTQKRDIAKAIAMAEQLRDER